MKKLTAVILILVLILSVAALASCGGGKTATDTTTAEEATEGTPNPWTDYDDAEAAMAGTGITLTFPETLNGKAAAAFRGMGETMLEIKYDVGTYVRKSVGEEDDISGDYNEYAVVETVTVGERTVTFKGDGETVSLALWTEDGFSYAVGAPGLSAADMTAVVEAVA